MKKIVLGSVAIVAVLFSSSVFVIDEGQAGIVVQFGKVKRDNDSLACRMSMSRVCTSRCR